MPPLLPARLGAKARRAPRLASSAEDVDARQPRACRYRSTLFYWTKPCFTVCYNMGNGDTFLEPEVGELDEGISVVALPLSQGKFAIIDAEDAERVAFYKWSAVKNISPSGLVTWYAVRHDHTPNASPKTIYLHRAVMGVTDRAIEVDHWDHDGLNCRKKNLRAGTSRDNSHNARKTGKATSSRFRGVTWQDGRWKAQIQPRPGERMYLGRYRDEEEAARAYDAAASRLWGKYANLNFPLSKTP